MNIYWKGMVAMLGKYALLFVMLLLSETNMYIQSDTSINDELYSWSIPSKESVFYVQNKSANNYIVDGYYVLEGNDKFCFEIHGNEARLSAELEEYANLNNAKNRQLVIGDYVDNNIYLSFEGNKPGDIFTYCQEFYSLEDDAFIAYYHCDEEKEPKTLTFKKQYVNN